MLLEGAGFYKSAYELCLWLDLNGTLEYDEKLLYSTILNSMDRHNEAMEVLQNILSQDLSDEKKSQIYVYLALVCHNMGDVRSEEMYLERDMPKLYTDVW